MTDIVTSDPMIAELTELMLAAGYNLQSVGGDLLFFDRTTNVQLTRRNDAVRTLTDAGLSLLAELQQADANKLSSKRVQR